MSIQIIGYTPKKTVTEQVVDESLANANALVKYIGIDANGLITSSNTSTTTTSSSDKSFGDIFITTSGTTHSFTIGVPFEVGSISGMTWYSGGLNNFEIPSNGRLKYKGTSQKTFIILFSLHAQMGSTNLTTGLVTVQKNGLHIPPSNTIIIPYVTSNTHFRTVNLHTITTLTLNDEISVWLTFGGSASTSSILLQDCNFTIIQI